MVGREIAQYRIEEELGRGGMGVVYKALDTSLNRNVALKFLPAFMTQDVEARERFVREAQAAAGIDHANICTIHEISQTEDGQTFIVMAYYGGDTLNDIIASGPLAPERVAHIGAQIADALSAAHARGIVHRDIKPGNVIVGEKDDVKLLDFGLAKLAGQVDLTQAGSTLGTAAYMSPEQVRGEVADTRTDIWSLGVVMYEMLAGERPFKGEYEQAVSYAILNETPKWPDGPEWLVSLIRSTMTGSVAERTISAAELAESLRHPGFAEGAAGQSGHASRPTSPQKKRLVTALGFLVLVVAVGSAIVALWPERSAGPFTTSEPTEIVPRSMAVLPFANLRRDPDTDYLGYALADQVIAALAYFKNVTVRPSSSIRQYDGPDVDAVQAGTDLKVDYVLSGTYLREADVVRLSLELVDLENNNLVWREPIEVAYENTFHLQDIVSQKVVDGLRVQFSTDEIARIRSDVPKDPVAYELFLRSIPLTSDIADTRVAAGLLLEAVTQDSTYAPAWGALGLRVRHLELYDSDYGGEYETAQSFLEKALSLNDQLLSTLSDLAVLHSDLGQLDEAYRYATRILEINPNSSFGHFALGYIYRYAGLLEESVQEMRTAIRLDSTDRRLRSAQVTFGSAGLYDEAVRAAFIDGNTPYARGAAGIARLRQGRIDDGLSFLRENLGGDPFWADWSKILIAGFEGNYAEGKTLVDGIVSDDISDAEIWYWNSVWYALNRDEESALRTLATSVERGYYNWRDMETNPWWDHVRDDRRFQDLVSRARRESDAFRTRNGID